MSNAGASIAYITLRHAVSICGASTANANGIANAGRPRQADGSNGESLIRSLRSSEWFGVQDANAATPPIVPESKLT